MSKVKVALAQTGICPMLALNTAKYIFKINE